MSPVALDAETADPSARSATSASQSPAAGWQRVKRLQGVALCLLGVALIVGGSLWAGREAGGLSMNGVWVGTIGVLVLVVGALFIRWGVAGPVPARLQERDA